MSLRRGFPGIGYASKMPRYKGVVQKGKRLATRLGFPTANIFVGKEGKLSGIFAAKVFFEGKEYPAAAYINQRRHMLEAHLFDFSGDLYGKEIEIELVKKIREDSSLIGSALRVAIEGDIAKIRKYFKN